MISVIVPTQNAEAGLVRTLSCLLEATMRGLVRDVVVADGGSTDLTLAIAEDAGCAIVKGGPSRGSLLNAGAMAAKSQWLLFLNANTALEPGWDGEAFSFVRQGGADRAATFRFALDDKSWSARRAELRARLRNKVLALPYREQGLLISRTQYQALGGFKDLTRMASVEFISRLKRQAGRSALTRLAARAVSSRSQLGRDIGLSLLTLYALGVSPERLEQLAGL